MGCLLICSVLKKQPTLFFSITSAGLKTPVCVRCTVKKALTCLASADLSKKEAPSLGVSAALSNDACFTGQQPSESYDANVFHFVLHTSSLISRLSG